MPAPSTGSSRPTWARRRCSSPPRCGSAGRHLQPDRLPRPCPRARAGGAEMQAFLATRAASRSVVRRVAIGERSRIAYALADPSTGLVVYAERAIPADRRAPVDRNSAFADLDYAIYLGTGTDTADMTTTDVDPATCRCKGLTARAAVPFGDTVLTLVTSAPGPPRQHPEPAPAVGPPGRRPAAHLALALVARQHRPVATTGGARHRDDHRALPARRRPVRRAARALGAPATGAPAPGQPGHPRHRDLHGVRRRRAGHRHRWGLVQRHRRR